MIPTCLLTSVRATSVPVRNWN